MILLYHVRYRCFSGIIIYQYLFKLFYLAVIIINTVSQIVFSYFSIKWSPNVTTFDHHVWPRIPNTRNLWTTEFSINQITKKDKFKFNRMYR